MPMTSPFASWVTNRSMAGFAARASPRPRGARRRIGGWPAAFRRRAASAARLWHRPEFAVLDLHLDGPDGGLPVGIEREPALDDVQVGLAQGRAQLVHVRSPPRA